MTLYKSHNLFWIRLNSSHNLTIAKIDLDMDSNISTIYKVAKC